jgi:hypothetical protein
MIIPRRTLSILLMTIVLIIFIQLIRMGLVLSLNSTANTLEYEYQQVQAQNLSEAEKGSRVKLSCLVIYNRDEQDELRNIGVVLRNMQFQIDIMSVDEHRTDYREYDLILILEQDSAQLSDLGKIIDFARNGGYLLYLGNGSLGRQDLLVANSTLFGIESWDKINEVTRIDFKTEILSGITGSLALAGDNNALEKQLSSLQVNLTADCLVHATGDQGNPVIWERGSNENIMVINTGFYANKRFRGLLTGAISVFLDTVIYPVTSSAVWQIVNIPIDEHVESTILKTNYSRNFDQYILDIWWRDMVAFMQKYNLKYTVAYLGSFDHNVDGPFSTRSLSETNLNTLTQAIIKSKGEISFQGYNNQPLLLTQTGLPSQSAVFWPDRIRMSEAIQCSTDFLKSLLPNYQIYTYVPPDNRLDDQAITVLRQSLPELKTISGAYFEQPGLSASQDPALFLQEFSVNEWYGIAFPQVTASCFLSDGTRFDMASVVTAQGIISHVIEADEILNPQKSRGLLWEDLYIKYDLLFKQTVQTYGWLNQDTVTAAAEKTKRAMNLDLYLTSNDQTISIACGNFDREATLILVTDKTITGSQGCDFKKIDSIRYLVTMHEKIASLEVGPE